MHHYCWRTINASACLSRYYLLVPLPLCCWPFLFFSIQTQHRHRHITIISFWLIDWYSPLRIKEHVNRHNLPKRVKSQVTWKHSPTSPISFSDIPSNFPVFFSFLFRVLFFLSIFWGLAVLQLSFFSSLSLFITPSFIPARSLATGCRQMNLHLLYYYPSVCKVSVIEPQSRILSIGGDELLLLTLPTALPLAFEEVSR